MSIWWAETADAPLVLVGPDDDWSDGNGSTLDEGNYGIWLSVDGDAGALLEGSLAELRAELERAIGLIEDAAYSEINDAGAV